MCVIVGFTQKTRGREEVLACLDRAYTRGPDMARVAENASGWLGFRRLSIMGLDERGMQPFALGPDQVVCNGELYGGGGSAQSWSRGATPSAAAATA
ncbi:hypothetical protein NE659_26085, partial [Flavonifractor plautii]|nr:hypothetical protein [Flavonifractor plautii]